MGGRRQDGLQEDVAHPAGVSGPAVRARRDGFPERLVDLAEEVQLLAQALLRDRADVLAPRAERRHLDGDAVEAVEQVGAHQPAALDLLDGEIQRGDHPHARLHELRPADADERPGLEKPEQRALRRRGHVLQLVEEQRPVARDVEDAGVRPAIGAGERARLVAAELRHRQLAVERAAVDRDEGTVAQRTRVVDAVRQQLLARARLADDQRRVATLGRAPADPDHPRQGFAPAADVVEGETRSPGAGHHARRQG